MIDLPNKTQGYRRNAGGYLGDPAGAAVVAESVRFGDQGGTACRCGRSPDGRTGR